MLGDLGAVILASQIVQVSDGFNRGNAHLGINTAYPYSRNDLEKTVYRYGDIEVGQSIQADCGFWCRERRAIIGVILESGRFQTKSGYWYEYEDVVRINYKINAKSAH